MSEISIERVEQFYDDVLDVVHDYKAFEPIIGMLLPFIEAFLPFLPLFVFVMANSALYGLLKGFLYSWLGSSLGSISVFLLIRKFGHKKIFIRIKNNQQVKYVTSWVERHGFGPLFILICFPFSPSSIINVVSGLSNVSKQQFILAVFLGKSVMIFSIAYIGASIVEFAKNPLKTIVVTFCIIVFWFIGKIVEKHLLGRKYSSDKKE